MTEHDDVEVMVLLHLLLLCKKLAKNPAVREELRVKAHKFVGEVMRFCHTVAEPLPFKILKGKDSSCG